MQRISISAPLLKEGSAEKCVNVVIVFEGMEADVGLVVSAIILRLLQLLLESVYRLPR